MNSLKTVMTLLATGGVAGLATHASAAATTEFYGYDASGDNHVTIGASSTPQFFYGQIAKSGSTTKSYSYGLQTYGAGYASGPGGFPGPNTAGSSANAYIGEVTTSPGLPSSGESYSSTAVQTASGTYNFDSKKSTFSPSTPAGGEYAHLSFDIGQTAYVGSAFIDGDAVLESITYEQASPAALPVSAAPEPDAWALLVAGIGLTGMVMRRRKTAQDAAVA